MEISVIGSGYVGLTTGACLARGKNNVILMDVDKNRVETLRKGELPIYEDGLLKLYNVARKSKKISVTDSYEKAIRGSELSFVCVGTPSAQDGSIDLSQVEGACDSICEQIARKGEEHTIVVRSTVVPGTCEGIRGTVFYHHFMGEKQVRPNLVMHPEHLAEGNAVADFMTPTKLVFGEDFVKTGSKQALQAYKDAGILSELPARNTHDIAHYLSLKEAEMEKYISNCWLATDIARINEFANICDAYQVDLFSVLPVVLKDPRMGSPKFITPGLGFGGSCFPKDVKAIVADVKNEKSYEPTLLNAILHANNQQPRRVAEEAYERFLAHEVGSLVNVYGVAFKGDTDDIRETPVLGFVKALENEGAIVRLTDPLADPKAVEKMFGLPLEKNWRKMSKEARLSVVAADHKEYKEQDFINMLYAMDDKGKSVLDAKNALKGEHFHRVGNIND